MSTPLAAVGTPEVSVVVATFNRGPRLLRLLRDLSQQTLGPRSFEIVVVDDGSVEPAAPLIEAQNLACQHTVIRQANSGVARARDRGIQAARGRLLVIVDDDMQVQPDFLERHLCAHQPPGSRRVVLGPIRPAEAHGRQPLFETYNAHRLEQFSQQAADGRLRLAGNNLCTGNVSMLRDDYIAVGGFDLTLPRSEDAELGLRLERSGVDFAFAADAPVFHDSDHSDSEWLRRAHVYGVVDTAIARKHPEVAHADPWRYAFVLPRLARPLLWLAILLPVLSKLVATAVLAAGRLARSVGLERLALRGAGLAYGMEYFRGLRDAGGGTRGALRARTRFLALAAAAPRPLPGVPRRRALFWKAVRDFRIDCSVRRANEDKYGYAGARSRFFLLELLQKIGLQLAAAYRMMWFFREVRWTLYAKLTSRMIRHLYGSDIHWDAELAPGVVFMHGMGMAISHAARVGPRCVLSHNVTLGLGMDPVTRGSGAPRLEENVHVGPGAVLFGPIVIGASTKIMANAVVHCSVPPDSVVEVPAPHIRSRIAQVELAKREEAS